MVEASTFGTEAVVKATCHVCKKEDTWHRQPTMPGSGIPAGNFLLFMAILVAGGSASKVLQIFSHMGLGCVSLNTFFKCQRVSIGHTFFLTCKVFNKVYVKSLVLQESDLHCISTGQH